MNAEKRFAERLQELVYDCGLKPEEISALCGVGLSRLRCWLSPRCTSLPCTRSLVKLADFFGCSLLYLLGLEEENSLDPPARKSARFLKAAFVSQRTARNKNIYAQTHGQTWRGFFLLQLDEKRLLARRLQSASVVGRFPLHARLPARQRGLKAGLKAATQKTANLKTTKKRAFSHGILKLV